MEGDTSTKGLLIIFMSDFASLVKAIRNKIFIPSECKIS